MESCSWPIDYANCASTDLTTGCSALEGISPERRLQFENAASDFLWNFTGRIFGECLVVIRPCSSDCYSARTNTFYGRGPYQWAYGHDVNGWAPALISGQWFNIGCSCIGFCSCKLDGAKSLSLPGPIIEVTQVRLDGIIVDPLTYEVTYGRFLTLRGSQRWPACQSLDLDASQPGTFEIQYTRGVSVPAGGRMAAGLLACELAKAYCKDNTCKLPERVQTITRQGVTVAFQDLFEGLTEGRTGIWPIDSWVASVNRPRPRSSVRSPDVKSTRVGSIAWPRT